MEKEVKDICGSIAQRNSVNRRSKERGLIVHRQYSLTSFEIAERSDIIQLLCFLGHHQYLPNLCHYLEMIRLWGGTYRVSAFLNQQKLLTCSEGGLSIYSKLWFFIGSGAFAVKKNGFKIMLVSSEAT